MAGLGGDSDSLHESRGQQAGVEDLFDLAARRKASPARQRRSGPGQRRHHALKLRVPSLASPSNLAISAALQLEGRCSAFKLEGRDSNAAAPGRGL